MLFVNNEPLSKEKHPDEWKEFEDGKRKILVDYKGKFPLVFMKKDAIRKDEKTGSLKPYLPTVVSWGARSQGKNGSVTWNYSPIGPEKDAKGIFRYPVSSEIIRVNGLVVRENEIDKLFFLIEKCSEIKWGTIVLVNKEKDADNEIDKYRSKVDAEYLLLSQNSTLAGDNLKTVARAYGINGVGALTDNMIRVQLKNKLEKLVKDDKFAYEKFVQDANVSNSIRIRANLQQAIDEQKVFINANHKSLEWVVNKGDNPSTIYNFTHEEFNDMHNAAVRYLESEGKQVYQTILKSLGNISDAVESVDLTSKDSVFSYAKSHGIKTGARKYIDVLEEVKQLLEQS